MEPDAFKRKQVAMEQAAKEANEVTEVFTSPPKECIFSKDSFVCWWNDLIPGKCSPPYKAVYIVAYIALAIVFFFFWRFPYFGDYFLERFILFGGCSFA